MPKIVIVEDDPMISEIYQKKFVEAGFTVLVADSGEQIINLVEKEKIDVILLDLILPKMSGFDVIKKIRNEKMDSGVKIIVFTNLNQSEDRQKAMDLGADGFIVKSEHTPSSLVKEVERLLHHFGEEKKNEIKISKLENGDKDKKEQPGKKILLIEDEEVFLEMFGDKLTQDGFLVTRASNGALTRKVWVASGVLTAGTSVKFSASSTFLNGRV